MIHTYIFTKLVIQLRPRNDARCDMDLMCLIAIKKLKQKQCDLTCLPMLP